MQTVGTRKFYRDLVGALAPVYSGEIIKIVNRKRDDEPVLYVVPPEQFTVTAGAEIVGATLTDLHHRFGMLRDHVRRGRVVRLTDGRLKTEVCYLVHPQYIQEEQQNDD